MSDSNQDFDVDSQEEQLDQDGDVNMPPASTSTPVSTKGKAKKKQRPKRQPDPAKRDSDSDGAEYSTDEAVSGDEIDFDPSMPLYHGAQRLPGKLKKIAERVKRVHMDKDKRNYPLVVELEKASGHHRDVTPTKLLYEVFAKFGVISRKPCHPLWEFYMDSRLFNEAQWKGITLPSQDKAEGKEPFELKFPRAIKHLKKVKRVRTSGTADSSKQPLEPPAPIAAAVPLRPFGTSAVTGTAGVSMGNHGGQTQTAFSNNAPWAQPQYNAPMFPPMLPTGPTYFNVIMPMGVPHAQQIAAAQVIQYLAQAFNVGVQNPAFMVYFISAGNQPAHFVGPPLTVESVGMRLVRQMNIQVMRYNADLSPAEQLEYIDLDNDVESWREVNTNTPPGTGLSGYTSSQLTWLVENGLAMLDWMHPDEREWYLAEL